jgi:pyrophosphatase PpaX
MATRGRRIHIAARSNRGHGEPAHRAGGHHPLHQLSLTALRAPSANSYLRGVSHSRPLAVLLDLDGTLVDSIDFILECVRYAFEGHPGRSPTEAEWTAEIGKPLRACFAPYARDDADMERLVGRYRTYQLDRFDALTRAFEDVPETVRALHAKGHPLAIVTGKNAATARRALELVGIDDLFPVVVGGDSCPGHKPDPEPVLLALALLGYPPDRAIFVGDSVHDMTAGRSAGVRTVAALWGASTPEMLEPAKPDYILASFSELPGLVDQLDGLASSQPQSH